ncbi:MAG: class I SAM-dependent methyltransferase [Nocardioides sp.]
MKQDERLAFDRALGRARRAAYPPGEFVEQESFMRAEEIRALAVRAGIGPGISVLDLCCGVAGPGRFVTAELGCSYLGVDSSASAIAIARERAAGLPCHFEVGRVPPVPHGLFDVVILLETMLAFADKQTLLREISSALPVGGRFAFTVEEGDPLNEAERQLMPDADTVWLLPLPHLVSLLEQVGLRVGWVDECSGAHREMADSLIDAFTADRSAIAVEVGDRALDELLAAHRLWSDWLGEGRVRKFAAVAEKIGQPGSLSTT